MPGSSLDHLVVNTRFETNAAQALFADLGFTLTPRGHHTLGSINHLVVFPQAYLELIGLPQGGGRLRQEILDSPVGIDGLVLASRDAEASHAALAAAGFAVSPVQHFSRPVEIDGQTHDARFSTVRLLPGQLPAGRVYVCQHHTPELLWRPEWTAHANGVRGIAGLAIVGPAPLRLRGDYARLGPLTPDFSTDFLDRAEFDARYGALASFLPAREDFFGAIRLAGGDPAAMAARATAMALPAAQTRDGLAIALPRFHTVLEFSA
ncbi:MULTISPECIES: VOC family protein [unclassified Variovorax]|uniref:VOC family protein n=1 Tax=unclassified Variovorax TaxID=663243 RepID=UPI00111A783A|nr:VOC family protein [Variovorax sp. KBS0712]TSD57004.1 VOC family protein [Variovorax sp. KBS0712]